MRISALLFSGLSCLVLFACSSEAPTGNTRGPSTAANQNDDDGDKAPAKPGNTENTSNTDGAEPAPTGGGSCGASANIDACFQCCGQANPAAVEKLDTSWMACACAADKCGTQCAPSVCAATPKDPAQGDACDTCLAAQDQACGQAASAACEADATCKKIFECEQTSKCDSKPEQ